jgi:hypothetical protein
MSKHRTMMTCMDCRSKAHSFLNMELNGEEPSNSWSLRIGLDS